MKNLFTRLKVLAVVGGLLLTSCSSEPTNNIATTNLDTKTMTLEQAVQNQSPSSRVENVYTVKKYIFNREGGAGGLGHVGVAFELRAVINGVTYTSFYQGAVEGNNGWFGVPLGFISQGDFNGGWTSQVSTQSQMFQEFRNRQYNRYKFGTSFTSTSFATSNVAKTLLSNFERRGYNLAGNNCMNAAYDVVATFSGTNGNPSVPNQFFPNSWYNNLTTARGWSGSKAL